MPETKRILFLGDEGSLSEFVDLKELLSGRTWILSGPRLIQLIKFRIVSGTIESLFHSVTICDLQTSRIFSKPIVSHFPV